MNGFMTHSVSSTIIYTFTLHSAHCYINSCLLPNPTAAGCPPPPSLCTAFQQFMTTTKYHETSALPIVEVENHFKPCLNLMVFVLYYCLALLCLCRPTAQHVHLFIIYLALPLSAQNDKMFFSSNLNVKTTKSVTFRFV